MVKALVTGGTGFVGSHVARVLQDAGHELRVLHRQNSKLDALKGLRYESVIGNLLDDEALQRACEGCSWLFHIAAVADYWQADLPRMYAANIEGTRRVLAAARKTGVQRVIFTSSAAAIGLREDGEAADESLYFAGSPEEFPYAYSKVMAERLVRHAVEHYGQDIVTVNPVIVLGPGDLNMISGRFITEVRRLQWTIPVTAGRIAVVDVRDVARWQLLAAEQGRSGERYILGTANYRLRDWYAMCAEVLGVVPPFLSAPRFILPLVAILVAALSSTGFKLPVDSSQVRLAMQDVHFDYRKAHEQFGAPRVPMYKSLQDTYMWYEENGYLKSDTLTKVIAALGRLVPGGSKPSF
jgi:dihydroflavonol-4-reductase